MALNREIVLQGVREIVAEQLNVALDKVTEESKFVEDFAADSLDEIELIMELEEEFGLDIPDDPDGQGITSVKLAVDYIFARKAGKDVSNPNDLAQASPEGGLLGAKPVQGIAGL